jgi:hypothetical protein
MVDNEAWPNIMYTINFGESDLEIDPSLDYIVRCRKYGAQILKYYDTEVRRPRSIFISMEVLEALAVDSPVPSHPNGGRLPIVERTLFERELEVWRQLQTDALEDWFEDEGWDGEE